MPCFVPSTSSPRSASFSSHSSPALSSFFLSFFVLPFCRSPLNFFFLAVARSYTALLVIALYLQLSLIIPHEYSYLSSPLSHNETFLFQYCVSNMSFFRLTFCTYNIFRRDILLRVLLSPPNVLCTAFCSCNTQTTAINFELSRDVCHY